MSNPFLAELAAATPQLYAEPAPAAAVVAPVPVPAAVAAAAAVAAPPELAAAAAPSPPNDGAEWPSLLGIPLPGFMFHPEETPETNKYNPGGRANLFGWKIPDGLFHDETEEDEANVLGLKIPDALFHAPTEDDETAVLGMKAPDFLFHEPHTEEGERNDARLFGFAIPDMLQNTLFEDEPAGKFAEQNAPSAGTLEAQAAQVQVQNWRCEFCAFHIPKSTPNAFEDVSKHELSCAARPPNDVRPNQAEV